MGEIVSIARWQDRRAGLIPDTEKQEARRRAVMGEVVTLDRWRLRRAGVIPDTEEAYARQRAYNAFKLANWKAMQERDRCISQGLPPPPNPFLPKQNP
jgi:predicted MarR family transcription regulator